MRDSEKLDLILNQLTTLENSVVNVENEIVNVNKRLTIMEGEVRTIHLKVDDLRTWTQLDLKDNPFLKSKRAG